MKIILAHKFYYRRDGGGTALFDLKELLEKNGHEVIPFAMRHPQNVPTEWSRYFVSFINFENPKSLSERMRAFCRMIYSREAYKKFEALVRDTRPDAVHVHNIYHQISPSILDVCAKWKIPVVMSVHDYKLICPNYKLFAHGKVEESCKGGNFFHEVFSRTVKNSFLGSLAVALESALHRHWKMYEKNIQKFIVPSEFARNKLVEFGMDGAKIAVLPHLNTHTPAPLPRVLGVTNSRKSGQDLIYVGRLAPEKGVDVLLRALALLPKSRLHIAGFGPEEENLKVLARELNVIDRVFFHGFQSKAGLEKLYQTCSTMVVPSIWYEVFGYSILEGLSHGMVVFGSRIGAIPELLGRVDPILLFEPGNAQELASKIELLQALPEKQKELSERSCTLALSYRTPKAYYETLLEMYARTEAVEQADPYQIKEKSLTHA